MANQPQTGAASLRWKECSPSHHPHEQAALAWLREALSGKDLRVWTNAEFVSRDGSIRELDAVVLGPKGFFVVEIKNHEGNLEAYGREWFFKRANGKGQPIDNPLFLANLKCKQLKELVLSKLGTRDPLFLQPVIFLSNLSVGAQLAENEKCWVTARSDAPVVARKELNDVVTLLANGFHKWPDRGNRPIESGLLQKLTRALDDLLTKRKPRERRAGNFVIDGLLDEGLGYQDWLAFHHANPRDKRRVRIYNTPDSSDPEQLDRIQRSAKREYDVLQPFSNARDAVPGLPMVQDYMVTDEGPCVLYSHEDGVQRLDHWLRLHEASLTATDRIRLLRSLGETLRQAHCSRLFHRGLKPSSILVHQSAPVWRIEIQHWHTAMRTPGTTDSLSDTGTLHPEALVEAPGLVYLAPELFADPQGSEFVDVFGLGAIAYRLFTGKPPANDVGERDQYLASVGWLSVSASADGMLPAIDKLVADSTRLDVALRCSLEEFLERCAEILEKNLEEGGEDLLANPLEANQGAILRDADRSLWKVVNRIGQGSSALGLRVTDSDGLRRVLKLARDSKYNERLREEATLLGRIEDSTSNVVRCHGVIEFDSPQGRLVALVLTDAGENLADRLRKDSQIPLASLERWGEDLLLAVEALETAGVFHRDLKPDNLGIQAADDNPTKRNRLVLYDFSLSKVAADQIRVGTQGYIEPWLTHRKPPRYDTAAERWAAVATLHELATGTLPRPDKNQLGLACERIPLYREQFTAFFERALAMDLDKRPGTARALRHEWNRIFEEGRAAEAALPQEMRRRSAEQSSATDHLATLDLDPEATNALVCNGICTVKELISHPGTKLYALRGVGGGKLRDVILNYRKRLLAAHPNLEHSTSLVGDGHLTTLTQELPDQAKGTLEHLAQVLIEAEKAELVQSGNVQAQLGLLELPEVRARFPQWENRVFPEATRRHPWARAKDWASAFGVTSAALSIPFNRAKESWRTKGRLRALVEWIQETLVAAGGVMGADDLASELARSRPSDRQDLLARQILARGVLRAILEVESLYTEPSFRMVRKENATFVVLAKIDPPPRGRKAGDPLPSRMAELLSGWVQALGEAADDLVKEWPLPSRQRVMDRLSRCALDRRELPDELPRPDSRTVVRLAALASVKARVDAREELYPCDIPVSRLVPLLVAGYPENEPLTLDVFNRLRQGRYPESEEISDRDEFNRVLQSFDFHSKSSATWIRSFSATGSLRSQSVAALTPTSTSVQILSRLDASRKQGGLLVLSVEPQVFAQAQSLVARRYPDLRLIDLDALLLQELRDYATANKIEWEKVLLADRPGPDRSRLQTVFANLHTALERRLGSLEGAVVVSNAGLWAHYNLLVLLERHLLRRAGTASLALVWFVVPDRNPSNLPTVNLKPIPIHGPQEHLELPKDWLRQEYAA